MDLKTCRWMTRLLYVGCLALAIIALPPGQPDSAHGAPGRGLGPGADGGHGPG